MARENGDRITKICTACHAELPLDAFYQRHGAQYATPYACAMQPCKGCHVEKVKARNATPQAKRDIRSLNLKRNYGISIEQYEALEQAQNGVCAICGEPPSGNSRGNKYLHVDHCHETGKVRALLCNLCNLGLGSFRDRSDLLKKGIEYLNEWGGQN